MQAPSARPLESYIADRVEELIAEPCEDSPNVPIFVAALRVVCRSLPDSAACLLGFQPTGSGNQMLVVVDPDKPNIRGHIRSLLAEQRGLICGHNHMAAVSMS